MRILLLLFVSASCFAGVTVTWVVDEQEVVVTHHETKYSQKFADEKAAKEFYVNLLSKSTATVVSIDAELDPVKVDVTKP